nr:transposase [Acetobacter thailandicus]
MSVVKPVVRLIRNHHQKILSLTLRGSSRDELLADLPDKIEEIIGGRGYDSNRIRLWLAERTITACIPPKKNRKSKPPYDWHLYKKRHLIENMFAKLKGWRRVATRYDRCAHTFMSAIHIAATVIFCLKECVLSLDIL